MNSNNFLETTRRARYRLCAALALSDRDSLSLEPFKCHADTAYAEGQEVEGGSCRLPGSGSPAPRGE